MVMVSACLLGVRCRYDGDSRPHEAVIDLARTTGVVPVCPEQLGGLPTPRAKADLRGGGGRSVVDGTARVVSEDGLDVTESFLRGARETVEVARRCRVRRAVLKDRSPSCGVSRVYVDGELVDGIGVTAAMLEREGVCVICCEDMD
jgi:uncharacterized protein YbbK (DUF523 family)